MLILRKAEERGQTSTAWLKSYHSFAFNDYFDRAWHHFHDLRVINEDFVAPQQGFGMHPHDNMEILTYVTDGALNHRDSLDHEFKVKAGDWQRMSAGTGIIHSEWNSENVPCHLFQIWVRPNVGNVAPSYEQKAFQRIEDQWQIIASGNPHGDTLFIHQDMQLLRYISSKAQTLDLNFDNKPHFLQMISGALDIADYHLEHTDALAIETETKLSLSLAAQTEILLFAFA